MGLTFKRHNKNAIYVNDVRIEVLPIEDDDALELESFSEERVGLMKLCTVHLNIRYDFSSDEVTLTLTQKDVKLGEITISREEFNKITIAEDSK